jgi:hypothetical protein
MKKRYIWFFILAALSIVMAGTAFSAGNTASTSQAAGKNAILLKATSPFEDLAESAISNNEQGMISALQAYEAQAPEVSRVLSLREQQELNPKVTDIKKAINIGNSPAVAMQAVEAYRVLIESLDQSALVVPVQVQMLDYAGFRLLALLNAKPMDWAAAQKTVEEARQQWSTLRPRVTDEALRDAFDTTIGGMKKAAASKNRDMLDFAAQADLAQVDLLEKYFEKSAS